MLRVHVLGELEVDVDGAPLAPPAGRRARALLAYLALHPGLHPRATLAARFWPDVLDESARTSLRGALADVRRAVGDALVATRESAGLPEVWTDAAEFAALLAGLEDDWIVAARDEHRDAQGALLARLADDARDAETALAHARARTALD